MKLRSYQREALQNFLDQRFNVCKWPRQSGKSTSFAAYVCWFVLFSEHKNVVILANKEKQSKELLKRIKMAYENLPYWLQQGIVSWNKLEFELENGCKVAASSTSSDAIRGESVALLIVDEVAHIPSNIWDDFWESIYPTISSAKQSKIILVSTPKGMNHFFKIWAQAEKNQEGKHGASDFWPYSIEWKDVPGYDLEWKKQTVRNIGVSKFYQEYDCKFLAAAASLVSADVVEKMEFGVPIELETLPIYDKIMNVSQKVDRWISIYEYPIDGHDYSMGVDPAKITEDSSGDSLALQIFDITDVPFVQVATVIIPTGLHYWNVPDLIEILGYWYNEAWVFIENNDSVGQEIADTLRIDFEYENLFREKAGVEGFRTTKRNKKIGCLALKMLIEDGKIKINDLDTIAQLSTFIKVQNSYKAERGYSDDAIMASIHSFTWMQDRMGFEHKRELIKKVNIRNIIKPMPTKEDKLNENESKSLWDDNQPTDFFSGESGDPYDNPDNRPFG